MQPNNLRVLVLCTVDTGLDAVAAVHQFSGAVCGIVGVHPDKADLDKVSGYTDVRLFGKNHRIPAHLVGSYGLKTESDKDLLQGLIFDLLWVAGWQRLIPAWLIESSPMGVLGVHGSPDGIQGGRGRSPQNWAILLNCQRFDLALFRITPGIDDGPVIAQRSFFYLEKDDIRISYYRTSLALADMVNEVLQHPELLESGTAQSDEGFYFPQRMPEDGYADWQLPMDTLSRHCRALTHPYPGMRTSSNSYDIRIWSCQAFDDQMNGKAGQIDFVFETGEFLVNALDGRLLVREWTAESDWKPQIGLQFDNHPFLNSLSKIVERHMEKYPENPVTPRIVRSIDSQ